MSNPLAKKFNIFSLLRFALPNVAMMIVLSLYIIIDGTFIAQILGTTALSAANMVYPVICLEMALAIMIATGGSAIIARQLGEGKVIAARQNLTFLLLIEIILGSLIALFGSLLAKKIVSWLGASSLQASLSVAYIRILFLFAPAFFLQAAFQTFFVTAGRPGLGLGLTIIAGLANVAFDYVLMAVFDLGIAGAAIATGIGYCLPAIFGLVYFSLTRQGQLYFVKPKLDWRVLGQSCCNGSSEMFTNLANAVSTFLFNYLFLKYYGEDGVAAITIVLYFQYIFVALYFGYANGIAPVISYKYGSGEKEQLRKIFKSSLILISIAALTFNSAFRLAIGKLTMIFASSESAVYQIVIDGYRIYFMAFFIMGLGIFASALFTALSDGKSSGIISFSRTFIFLIGAILIFPLFLSKTGLWIAVPVAEVLGTIVAASFLFAKRREFGYL